jgi:Zn-finger nucleic acid-binding protein
MQCPVCDERMKEIERQGVAIDVCPGCKGVWLDRGELEKLIEMSGQADGPVPDAPRSDQPQDSRPPEREVRASDHDRHGHDDHDDHGREKSYRDERGHGQSQGQSQNRRKGSWLGDILGGIGGGED